MNDLAIGGLQRRVVLGGALAGAFGLAWPQRQLRGRVIIQRGVFGGGLAQLQSGEANFAISASRLIVPDENQEVVLGTMAWSDVAAGVELLSTRITDYERLDLPAEQGQGRRVTGLAATPDGTEYPFVMEVFDTGGPGSGHDSVSLMAGDGAASEPGATPVSDLGFNYTASGQMVTGDIRAVDVEIDLENGDVVPAPPA